MTITNTIIKTAASLLLVAAFDVVGGAIKPIGAVVVPAAIAQEDPASSRC